MDVAGRVADGLGKIPTAVALKIGEGVTEAAGAVEGAVSAGRVLSRVPAGAALGAVAVGSLFLLAGDSPQSRPAPRSSPQPSSAPTDGLLNYYWFPDIAIDPDILPAPDGGPVAGGAPSSGGTGRGPSQTRTQTRTSIRTQSKPLLKRDTRVPPLPAPLVKPVPPAGTVVSPVPNIEWPDGWSPDGAPYVLQDCVPGTCADSFPSGDGASGQGTDGGCGLAEGSLPLATTCRPDEPVPVPAAGGEGRPPRDRDLPASPGYPDDNKRSDYTSIYRTSPMERGTSELDHGLDAKNFPRTDDGLLDGAAHFGNEKTAMEYAQMHAGETHGVGFRSDVPTEWLQRNIAAGKIEVWEGLTEDHLEYVISRELFDEFNTFSRSPWSGR